MGVQHADEELIARAGVTLPVKAKVTPMMRQWLSAKIKAKGAILLFRMGDFYELFAGDAEEAAPILDLTVTTREKAKGKDAAIAMAGFPHHAAPAYIAKLIGAGLKVAVCDQLEDPALARGIVKRGVTRVVTPGMVIEENSLDAKTYNWLVAVAGSGPEWGIAALEVSCGSFIAGLTLSDQALCDEIARLNPAEIVLAEDADMSAELITRFCARSDGQPPRRIERRPPPSARALAGKPKAGTALHSLDQSLDSWLLEKPHRAAKLAAELAAAYLLDAQGRLPEHIRAPRPFRPDQLLLIDATTRHHLAVTGPAGALRRPGTLVHVVDKTKTAPGGRLLLSMLLAPSTDRALIEERLDKVQALIEDPGVRAGAREALAGVHDIERLVGRAASGRITPRELGNLQKALSRVPSVLEALVKPSGGPAKKAPAAKKAEAAGPLHALVATIDPLAGLTQHLQAALVEEPPSALGGGPIFCSGFDSDLDELTTLATGGQEAIAEVERAERIATGIPNLKVKYTRVFGYYLEVTRTHLKKVPKHYKRKQTVANAERFVTDELAALEEKVARAQERAREREGELFEALRKKVAASSIALLDLAAGIAKIDALAAFAEVSDSNGWSRPQLLSAQERRLKIEEGRHPMVEHALRQSGEVFVPSSVELNADDRQILIVTGPNMAGKSTMMRQIALVQLLAQAGCFVPAAKAELSLCDRIFTRVGASDDLAEGRSTFMVEMSETAHILHNASPHSLLLLDEIGRGTATFDGLSLAWAVAEHIHDDVGARTLFATHYHELCDLSLTLPRVKNVHVVVKEWNDQIIFTRTLAEGGAERSYGIQVARLAGLPAGVLARARSVLAELEGDVAHDDDDESSPLRALHALKMRRRKGRDQMDFFGGKAPPAKGEQRREDPAYELLEKLAGLDIDRMTPMSALNRLDEVVRDAQRQMKRIKD